ncbi:MAG: ATPase [Saprospiraceae bacterium]|nr:ATPase [Saprospiraceae bacterium]
MGITGVYTESSGFIAKSDTQKGFQIDMILDRKDQIISLIEMKFYNTQWTMGKEEAENLKYKKDQFKMLTKTSKLVFLTLISTFGLNPNINSIGLVDNDLTMNCLFEPN